MEMVEMEMKTCLLGKTNMLHSIHCHDHTGAAALAAALKSNKTLTELE
jgi:hypothetical protein